MFGIPYDLKEKLHNDEAQINIRIHFPNGERTDICNDLIVSGSAKLAESLCSQNELRFGLCESPVFECETVGVGNIKDATFDLTYEILCEPNVAGSVWKTDIQQFVFEIPMGKFVVQSCERQADLQHRKIMAYGGGAATNWNMPELERAKIEYMLKNKTYNVNISALISSLFYLENQEELELQELEFVQTYRMSSSSEYEIGVKYLTTKVFSSFSPEIIKPIYRYNNSFDAAFEEFKKKTEEAYLNPEILRYMDTAHKKAKKGAYINGIHGNVTDFDNVIYCTIESGKNVYIGNLLNETTSICYFAIPYSFIYIYKYNGTENARIEVPFLDAENAKVYRCESNIPPYYLTVNKNNAKDYLEIDLQKQLEAIIEIYGKIGRVSRRNIFELIDIKKQFYLMPSDDLKPAEQLRPLGVVGDSISKSMYSDCWYDEAYTKPYGAVYCQYKDTNNEQQAVILFCEGYDEQTNITDYQIYDMSSNDIIKNSLYTTEQIVTIMQNIADAISNVTYVPVDAKTVALPYVECGDTLEVLTENNDSINTIVLKRVLSGESYVVDEFISK